MNFSSWYSIGRQDRADTFRTLCCHAATGMCTVGNCGREWLNLSLRRICLERMGRNSRSCFGSDRTARQCSLQVHHLHSPVCLQKQHTVSESHTSKRTPQLLLHSRVAHMKPLEVPICSGRLQACVLLGVLQRAWLPLAALPVYEHKLFHLSAVLTSFSHPAGKYAAVFLCGRYAI